MKYTGGKIQVNTMQENSKEWLSKKLLYMQPLSNTVFMVDSSDMAKNVIP